MTTTMRGRLIATAFFAVAAVPALAQQSSPAPPAASQPSTAWWRSESFRKELGLSPDQSARIDKIWESTRPELRAEWDEFTKLEGKLSRMIQHDADEAALSRQIDRVETARASVNKTRALMLFQMRKVLLPDQRKKFDEMYMRWLEAQRAPSSSTQTPQKPG
jgi:Spy/CpxP family protein refolding chaperone